MKRLRVVLALLAALALAALHDHTRESHRERMDALTRSWGAVPMGASQ